MKRKKFVKQLLSVRVSRNQANQLAKIAQELGVGYFKALGDFMVLCKIRAVNAWFDGAVIWQTAEDNVWLGVLQNE